MVWSQSGHVSIECVTYVFAQELQRNRLEDGRLEVWDALASSVPLSCVSDVLEPSGRKALVTFAMKLILGGRGRTGINRHTDFTNVNPVSLTPYR